MNYFDTTEPDVDDDGNPLTVSAAMRVFHKHEGTNRIFCAQQSFTSPRDAVHALNKRKAHIHDLIQKAREDQLVKMSETMGKCVKADLKVQAMPVIRVLPKAKRNAS